MRSYFQSRRNKIFYYITGHFRRLIPEKINILRYEKILNKFENSENNQLFNRINYYLNFNDRFSIDSSYISIKDISMNDGSYSLDLYRYSRFFNEDLKLKYLFGDVNYEPKYPALVKSRPVSTGSNSILLKLNELRHFYFIKSDIPFSQKKNALVWRGGAHQVHRKEFLSRFYKKSLIIDVGEPSKSNREGIYPAQFLTINEQLRYKFILSIEGNDVATNTKWIMSSNSLCFMTKPRYETWYMEGALKPNFHYVCIKDDYSDLEEKLNYYIEHSDEAEFIINNAKNYVRQFMNKDQELFLNVKVLEKYFKLSGQL